MVIPKVYRALVPSFKEFSSPTETPFLSDTQNTTDGMDLTDLPTTPDLSTTSIFFGGMNIVIYVVIPLCYSCWFNNHQRTATFVFIYFLNLIYHRVALSITNNTDSTLDNVGCYVDALDLRFRPRLKKNPFLI